MAPLAGGHLVGDLDTAAIRVVDVDTDGVAVVRNPLNRDVSLLDPVADLLILANGFGRYAGGPSELANRQQSCHATSSLCDLCQERYTFPLIGGLEAWHRTGLSVSH